MNNNKEYWITCGTYNTPSYKRLTYTSKTWVMKKLKQLNYPYNELINNIDWNDYNTHYKLRIY